MSKLRFFIEYIIFTAMLCFFLFMICAGCTPEGCVQAGNQEPTEQQLEQKHRYHGILFSEQDEQGNWWGVRETGERFLMWRVK